MATSQVPEEAGVPLEIPLEITFRDMDRSSALEDAIRKRVSGLSRHGRVLSCRVVVEAPHRHHRQGRLHHVRVRLTLPGREIVVRREHHDHHEHEDPFVAVRDAFDAARRQVQDFVRERWGATKTHEPVAHGEVARLLPDRDCGFIAAADGREVYFHRNSVLDGAFDRLDVGAPVRFVEEQGEEGPQASTVLPIGRHHPA